MNTRSLTACLLFLSTGYASADTLPLRHGAYVGVGTGCENPPNAELRTYDGRGLGSAKAADCRGRVLSTQNDIYQIEQDCREYGSPKPERVTERATIRIDGPDRYTDLTRNGNESFRLCPGLKP
ncbi:hypothetical protein ABZT49_24430 [Methylobacterium sp. EM32]|uniref:hypothetical protein n=1 Tax=Methylobacterium sp. EM32 TaxID=3163481 RepID=UPI0033B71E86